MSKQVIEAKTSDALYAPFEELKGIYFKDNKYSEFSAFLKSLERKNKLAEPFINYYTALARYAQLKYLEEKQMWDEYFAQGNSYRDEITLGLKNAVDKTLATDALNIYARLLVWQFHKDQQDAFEEESLSGLMGALEEFIKSSDDLKPLKDAADKLSSYGEKSKSRELYKAYAKKIASSDMNDEALLKAASDFYKEGNLELSETLYDGYIARVLTSSPKEKAALALTTTAKLFAYKDGALCDAFYAEKVFKKLEGLAGKDAFDQELTYSRAFNLEKAKNFAESKDIYIDLINRFPEAAYRDEAMLKAGIISTYVSGNIKAGREYFEKLSEKEEDLNAYQICGLYQLGLLSQWEKDFDKAKGYYNRLIALSKDEFQDTLELTRERLKEIEEEKQMEYNLKTFMDISFKENALYNMGRSDLKASAYRLSKGQEVKIISGADIPESGCMQAELQYLWSGNIGSTKLSPQEKAFDMSYSTPGTKQINLIVVSSTGIVDRNIDLVDVY